MAKVTYRGISYDTENRPNQTEKPTDIVELYRGVKFHVNKEGHKRVLTTAQELSKLIPTTYSSRGYFYGEKKAQAAA